MATPRILFDETQPAGRWLKAIWLLIVAGSFFFVGVLKGAALSLAAAALLLYFLFRSLRVTVDEHAVHLRFGSGWPRRSIPMTRIISQRPVRNRWWYGFGIRLTPHGWLWNLDGLDAVEVGFRESGTFRIGTRDPERLSEAIAAARRAASPQATASPEDTTATPGL